MAFERQFIPLETLEKNRIRECTDWYERRSGLGFFRSPLPSKPLASPHPAHRCSGLAGEGFRMDMKAWTSLAIHALADRFDILDAAFSDNSDISRLSIKVPPRYENGTPACWIDIAYDSEETSLSLERKDVVRIPSSCVLQSREAIAGYRTMRDILHVSDDGQVYAGFKTYHRAETALERVPGMVEMFQDVVDRIYPDLLCSSELRAPILKTHPCICDADKREVAESLIYGPLKDAPDSWYYKSICRCKNCRGYLVLDIECGQDGDPGPLVTRTHPIDGLAAAEAAQMFYYSWMWEYSHEGRFSYLAYSPEKDDNNKRMETTNIPRLS